MFNYCIDFRSLKCDRLRVHKNFMVSLIIRYVVSVIYYEPYIYGDPKAYVWYRGYVSFKAKIIGTLLRNNRFLLKVFAPANG